MLWVTIFPLAVGTGPGPIVQIQTVSNVTKMIVASHLKHAKNMEGIGCEAIECGVCHVGRLVQMVLHHHIQGYFLQ